MRMTVVTYERMQAHEREHWSLHRVGCRGIVGDIDRHDGWARAVSGASWRDGVAAALTGGEGWDATHVRVCRCVAGLSDA